MTDPRASASVVVKTWTIWPVVAGILFMAAGVALAYLAVSAEPHNMLFFWTAVVFFGFGGLCFPSVLPIAKNVYITVFPNGIPLLGGRRASDPQPTEKP